jgi:SAM-dependent methyltransferase
MTKPNFFGRGSPYLAHPLLTPQRTKAEIDFLLSKISIPDAGFILDIGCAFGRHSIELAQRGYSVVGVDPSQAMIEASRQASSGMDKPPQFVQVSAEDYQTDQYFDAVMCLFTTLGQIEGDQDNHRLVGQAANLLKPGGYFIVEVPHCKWLIKNLKTNEEFQTPESNTVIERSYNTEDSIVTEIFTIETPAERRVFLLRYRIFDIMELEQLLRSSGLKVINTYGGYQDVPLDKESPVIVMFSTFN